MTRRPGAPRGRGPAALAVAAASLLAIGSGPPASSVPGQAPGHWELDLKRPDPRRAHVSVLSGMEPLEWAGFSLGAGDLNRDGIADLVVGAPGGTDDRPSRRGRLYVVLGRPAPLPPALALGRPRGSRPASRGPAVPGLDTPSARGGATADSGPAGAASTVAPAAGADLVIEGPGDFDHFGRALVVADLDGDGAADIVAGAPRADGPLEARADCGEVIILFGAADLPSIVDLSRPAPGVRVSRLIGRAAGDSLGSSLATGDVAGDELPELILGAPLADGAAGPLGAQDVGEVFVIPGRDTWPDVLDLAGGVKGARVIRGEDPGDQAGSALATGDFDADGVADLAIGSRGADGPGNQRPDAGETVLLWGSRPPRPGALPVAPALLDPVVVPGARIGDLAGSSLAMGDADGDGHADLAIGAPLSDGPTGARLDAGGVLVVAGRPRSVVAALRDAAPASQLPGRPMNERREPATAAGPLVLDPAPSPAALSRPLPAGSFLVHGADPGDHTGVRAATDLDGDGMADLVIGAEDSAGRRNGRAGAGELRILLGRARFDAALDLRALHVPVIFGAVGGSHLGLAALVADLDGDALGELIVAAPPAGQSLAGRVYVLRAVGRSLPSVPAAK